MNDSAADAAPAAAAAPPGSPLAAARHAAGLSVADVGRQLKLSTSQVEALEGGDYARLPGPVFVRGFLRNYARLLRIDPAPLLAGLAVQVPVVAAVVPAPAPSTHILFPGQRRFRWKPFAFAGLLILAGLAVYELFGDDPAAPDTDTRIVELPQPKVVEEVKAAEPAPPVADVMPPAPSAAPASPAVTAPQNPPAAPVKAPVEARPAAVAKPAVEAASVPAARAAAEQRPARAAPAADERVVRLMFTRDSWVEVRDRQGRVIFSQLNPAGTTQAVSGQPPLRLVVGNAGGVRMLYNEQAVDLAPHTQVDVARLTLE